MVSVEFLDRQANCVTLIMPYSLFANDVTWGGAKRNVGLQGIGT